MRKVPFAKWSFKKTTVTITLYVKQDGNSFSKTNAVGRQQRKQEETGKSKKHKHTNCTGFCNYQNVLEAGRANFDIQDFKL